MHPVIAPNAGESTASIPALPIIEFTVLSLPPLAGHLV